MEKLCLCLDEEVKDWAHNCAISKIYFSIFSTTKELLPAAYTTKERGKIEVKGKGEMTTYWVESKSNRKSPSKAEVHMSYKI